MAKQPGFYEAMYILDTSLDETAQQNICAALENAVTQAGGEVLDTREFGYRRLAFEINGHSDGLYMLLYFRGTGEVVDELKQEMRLNENIIRSTVVVGDKATVYPAKKGREDVEVEEPLVEAPAEEAAAVEEEAETPAPEVEQDAEAVEEVAEAAEEVAEAAEEEAAAPAETDEEVAEEAVEEAAEEVEEAAEEAAADEDAEEKTE